MSILEHGIAIALSFEDWVLRELNCFNQINYFGHPFVLLLTIDKGAITTNQK
jgi:hypothetical protein